MEHVYESDGVIECADGVAVCERGAAAGEGSKAHEGAMEGGEGGVVEGFEEEALALASEDAEVVDS